MPREGALIVYANEGVSHSRANRLVQLLYGQDTTTRGQVYHRHGLLEDIPHWRIKRGVFVVLAKDRPRVVELLEQYAGKVYWWQVNLTPEDLTRLRVPG